MRKPISRFGLVLVGLGTFGLTTGAHAQFTLSSALTYSGRQTGEVWVVASPFKEPLITTFSTRLGEPASAPFTNAPVAITNVVGTYYLFAWRDSIANGIPDATEAQGWHPNNPFVVTSNRTVTGFVLVDPDSDFDGLPDFWEMNYGLPTYPGSGSAGALTLGAGETVFTDTLWASVAGSNPANTNTLNLSTNRGFTTNDLVLIVTMQDTNTNWAMNKAGTFEFARVASASSNVLTLRSNRLNAFTVGTSNKIQVLKVPEYTELTMLPAFALQFNGTSDYVQGGNVPLANTSFSIEAWARRDTTGTMDMIVAQGAGAAYAGLMFGFHWYGFVFDFYGDGAVQSDVDNAWHHWAGTYDAANRLQRLYRDGVLLATHVAAQPYQGSGPLIVGGEPFDDPARFAGVIDEVRIWNKVRNQAEIQADMNRGLTGTEPGLLAYYRFDEGAGTSVADATGHGYDGVTQGSPVWVLPRLNSPTTLTCQPWNGTNGGVLAFLAHQITLSSNTFISADGKGYRGGDGVAADGGDYAYGKAGERTTGFSAGREILTCLERPQGGGGAGKGADGSGGGGCYGGPGTNGAKALVGSDYGRGATNLFGVTNLSRLYSGGGGGGSGSHTASRVGVAGGAGGGVVFIAAGTIAGNGVISSRGTAGQPGVTNGVVPMDANQGSGGGGGAGGSVYVVGNLANSVQVLATGGLGGIRHPLPAGSTNGGAGGVGRIRFDLPPEVPVPVITLPAAGYTNQSLAGLSLIPGGDAYDSDHDGLSDRQEYDADSNPRNPDTDGDTLPDKWEVDHGLNPLSAADASAGQDLDGDGVENMLEFYRGTRPDLADTDGDGLTDSEELFAYHTDPLKTDTDGDGVSDTAEVTAGSDPLFSGIRYFYDPLDRLVGAQYETGLGLGYEYDGNNNILRQVYTQRDGNTNSLPDLWEFLHGLTNNTSGFGDTDGDSWSDYQEWQAGSDPRDVNSKPNILGEAGTNIASLTLPFTPSNFVVGVGQLDGIGAEEIVLGADGNPGAQTNWLLVLSQTISGWTTQRVDVGSFGVTSIAVGQPANRPAAAIYVGLRQTGGAGRVMEFTPIDGGWTSNTVAVSTSEEAFVLGVRAGRQLLASLTTSNAPPGCPYYLSYSSGWTNVLATTGPSQRGLGTVTPGSLAATSRGLRLLDSGGIQVVGHDVNVLTNAIWNEAYSKWFALLPDARTWESAQTQARTNGGNLATVTDATLNAWLVDQFWAATSASGGYWIGLVISNWTCGNPWQWASGASVTYYNWMSGQPDCSTGEYMVHVANAAGQWNDLNRSATRRGVVEVGAVENRSISVVEPFAAHRLLWRGHSLHSGSLRLTNALSILYTFVEDKNLNDVMDAGDEFVMAECLFSGTNVTLNDLQRIPLSGASLAQSYGLASVDVLYGNQQTFFTGEPDGRLYAWSATHTSPSLQRQLFSAHHAGMGWHALTGVRSLESGQSLIGLRVDPITPNRCDLIRWPPQQQLPVLAEVPQTAPVTQIQSTPNLGRDIARVDIRIWDAEGNASRPELHYRWSGQSNWSNATITAVNGAAYGFAATSPTGRTHQVNWDAARDLGPGFTNAVNLRARAQDLTLTGEWSPPVAYAVQNSLANNPRAYPDFASTPQGTPINIDVLGNDTVQNSAPKLIASLGAPDHGSAATNLNKTVRYTPQPDFVGTDQFVYTLTDGAGAYSMATVTVTVTPGAPEVILLTSPSLQSSNQFSMTIWGPAGYVYQVQASTNLTSWLTVKTVTNVAGTVPFTEQVPVNAPARFYRVLLVP